MALPDPKLRHETDDALATVDQGAALEEATSVRERSPRRTNHLVSVRISGTWGRFV